MSNTLTRDDIPPHTPETITLLDGRTVTIRVEPDESMGAPWEEHDGHGIVSEWTSRDKRPGELVLARDRRSVRYYDFAESVKLARRDGWGAEGRTRRERAARAALEDYRRLVSWCNGDWQFVGVIVEASDGQIDSLWGIESDGDYWRDIAAELINGLTALDA